MKRTIVLLLLSVVLLTACGSGDAQPLEEEAYRNGKDVYFLFTSPG